MSELPIPISDRRRVPRSVITDAEISVLSFPVPVRLIDISLAGVLLEASTPFESGTRGTVRFNFGGAPFSAEVKVERIEGLHGPLERFRIGASFVALNLDDQRVVERFSDQ
jgi:hypothetical protein